MILDLAPQIDGHAVKLAQTIAALQALEDKLAILAAPGASPK